jgi:hypothetical protein
MPFRELICAGKTAIFAFLLPDSQKSLTLKPHRSQTSTSNSLSKTVTEMYVICSFWQCVWCCQRHCGASSSPERQIGLNPLLNLGFLHQSENIRTRIIYAIYRQPTLVMSAANDCIRATWCQCCCDIICYHFATGSAFIKANACVPIESIVATCEHSNMNSYSLWQSFRIVV